MMTEPTEPETKQEIPEPKPDGDELPELIKLELDLIMNFYKTRTIQITRYVEGLTDASKLADALDFDGAHEQIELLIRGAIAKYDNDELVHYRNLLKAFKSER